MRFLIVGCGLVGRVLAAQLRAEGHLVRGTTTTPDKVAALRRLCDEVLVLRGSDGPAVAAALEGCDGAAICAGPSPAQAQTPEQRRAHYHEILVGTARSIAAAKSAAPIAALSSMIVYGDADPGAARLDEDSPLRPPSDASPACFREMERIYMQQDARSCVFRLADVYGADDPPLREKVRMAHQYMGGAVPFAAGALYYRVAADDVARAMRFAFQHGLRGLYNLSHEEVPLRNRELFDAHCAAAGLPPLHYRGDLRMAQAPVSSQKLLRTGFHLQHTTAAQLPEAPDVPEPA